MPGHKRRLYADDALKSVYGIDVTETEDFDDLHNAEGILKEAQERAARVFGSDRTYFLVNGSTGGILAAVCAAAGDEDELIIASNCHRSVYNAAMMSGANVRFIYPSVEPFGIYAGISAKAVLEALDETDGNRSRTVVVTSPTYEGVTSNIKEIADVCKDHGAHLIVDAAHGAHFGLSEKFCESPVKYADVVVTSVHKTLPAMTQTALMHVNKDCPFADRIKKMLEVFMTSSPSYVLMSSIDSMSHLLEKDGRRLFDEYAKRLDDLYDRARTLKNLKLLTKDDLTNEGSYDHDKGKIVVNDKSGRFTGKEIAYRLKTDFGLVAEMAAAGHVILMTSIADTDEAFARLKEALTEIDVLIERSQGTGRSNMHRDLPDRVISAATDMRSAVFSGSKESIDIKISTGRISADLVTVYPPGIPVIIPGERISEGSVNAVTAAMTDGREVTGLNNGKISVLWERSSI